MADQKITDFSADASPAAADLVVTAKSPFGAGSNRKVTLANMAALVNASPTITGHATIEGVTATGATGTGKLVFDTSPTMAGNLTFSASTGGSPVGIIYKGANRFIHDFNYGNNGTVTTIGRNTFVGVNAGNLTMGSTGTTGDHGSNNTAVGNTSLTSVTTGFKNVAIGVTCLNNLTTGNGNTAAGYQCMTECVSGENNAAYGQNSMFSTTTGSNNSALGLDALFGNTGGGYNSALGYLAGRYIADGSTANTTGDYNVFLGASTKALADNDQNEIVIGYNAIGLGSNSVVLGSSAVTLTRLRTNVGIGVDAPSAYLHLKAGTATASTAPLKFTTGTALTTPEAGAMEYNSGRFTLTDTDGARQHVVLATASTKTTAGAPLTNDGYVTIYINGTAIKVMTTA